MKFTPTAIHGAFLVESDPATDDRGFFFRAFCNREFEAHGLSPNFVQCNICGNYGKGTLRGLHYQMAPALESKFIRCIRGAIHDVIVDLRPDSPTFLQHVAVELSSENRRALYAPPMCAHGYQTLTDDAHVFYQTGANYAPEQERGVRHDDPRLGLSWPLPVTSISEKDAHWPRLGRSSETPIPTDRTRILA